MAKVTKKEFQKTNLTMHEEIFEIIEKDQNFIIALGNKIISQKTFTSVDDAKKYIDSKPWELIINATLVVYDLSKATKKH